MIIFRYLAREVLISMVAISGVLLLIIMSGRFVKYLAEAAAGKLAPDVLLAIMGYRLPGFLELVLPLGLFIAILMAYGRLYMDSEMTILSACGISPRRLLGYTLMPALFVAVIVGMLSLFISPAGVQKAELILNEQKKRSEFDHLKPTRFMPSDGGSGVTYAESLSDDRKEMQIVFMAEMGDAAEGEQAKLDVVLAKRGEQVVDEATGQRYLKLYDGYRYSGRPGQADYQVIEFDTYRQLLEQPRGIDRRNVKADSLTTAELMEKDSLENTAALQWRFSLPLLVVIVTLLAVPLSRTNPRQGRYVQMIPAILIYIIYLVSLNAARGALESGNLSPVPGIWPVHGVFLALAALLIFWPDIQIVMAKNKHAKLVSASQSAGEDR
ncbi:MAG: LPS export ABC transporter permease LptF [Candidatus Pelagadaptatus aseana]|uniref:LPS export ABC transporter permease LptF n=1 Tax=Candidatus Pelagadaptatus aseana TaxID=3120508 RepID=UPI0039B1DDE9